ncbi:MAG: aerobic carbon-monoxide dehydrogenase medium subunit [Solirubrobacteraceae bacterium]|jgi:carbon-monoxide dehydrogenase medium subunit|nr:aerobic carbon-monoxide dehydrogenase medium subunit [Solirubrobacteraceae bacterium]
MQVPAPFEYERATSVEQALELLQARGPEARLLAGGHSLLPMMKLRLAAPEFLIDIDALAGELGYIREAGGEVRIGAMTRHRALLESELIGSRLTIINDAEHVIADPVVRNRGTIGGALCQADPAEDLSSVCAALGATLVVRGLDGERTLSMQEFHRGPYETAVGDAEMLTEVRIPLRDGAGSAYEKVERRAGDWAVAAAGAAVSLSGGAFDHATIALTAVGGGVTEPEAGASLVGQAPSDEAFARAAELAAEGCSPNEDQRGSVAYKRHLARELTLRALRSASARALREEA